MPSDSELLTQQDPGKPRPAEPDVVEDWLRERAGLLDLPAAPGPEDAGPG